MQGVSEHVSAHSDCWSSHELTNRLGLPGRGIAILRPPINLNMKKWMFTAVLCLPLALMAQNRGGATPPNSRSANKTAATIAGGGQKNLCAEVLITDRGGMTSVVIDFGAAPEITYANDKMVKSNVKALQASRFTNPVDALNALTQLGFDVAGSYQTGVGNSNTTHIILTKPGAMGQPAKSNSADPAGGGATTPGDKKKRK